MTKKFRFTKRALGILLGGAMVLSAVPATVFAADGDACISTDNCSGTYKNGICSECDGYEPAVDSNDDGYYEIGNAGQLYWFADKVNNDNTNYATANAILTNNITVNENVLAENGEPNRGTIKEWTPIGGASYYKGNFNGNGKIVKGLYINKYSTSSGTTKIGFIGNYYNASGKVSNLTVEDSYFAGYSWVGGIVGYLMSGTIENCVNKATIKVYQNGGGVTAGSNNAVTLTNCRNDGLVKAGNIGGGLAGQIKYASKITNCVNTGNVEWVSDTRGRLGGFIGVLQASSGCKIKNCYNTGNVILNQNYTSSFSFDIGGFSSVISYVNLENCYSTGKIITTDKCNATKACFAVSCYGTTNGTTTASNCYVISDESIPSFNSNSANITVTEKDADTFASGEVCYLLNGSTSQGDLVWYQTIGKDASPNFNSKIVYCDSVNNKYYNDSENVKYQISKDNSQIRFLWIVDKATLEEATEGSCRLTSSTSSELDYDNTTEITSAYRSVYANGVLVKAPEGKVFVISPTISGLSDTTKVSAYFKLDNTETEARFYQ